MDPFLLHFLWGAGSAMALAAFVLAVLAICRK